MSTTKWTEVIAPDEAERFERYAAELRGMQRTAAGSGPVTERALHPKSHGGVVGVLRVPELAADLRVGPFATPAEWPLYARFSNGAPRHAHDKAPDIRGAALKLVGVPGRKIMHGREDATTQDFLFITTSATAVKGPDEFMALLRAAAKGPALLIPRLIGALGFGRAMSIVKRFAAMKPVTSVAATTFYTAAPVRFGDTAAKLSIEPVGTDATQRGAGGKTALRGDLAERLKTGPVAYTLRAQLFVDDATTPIEDASVDWPVSASPWRALGTLTLAQQDMDSPRGREIGALVEGMSFDPWHALPELRPLGAMMRARGAAYRVSVIERGVGAEPTSVLSL